MFLSDKEKQAKSMEDDFGVMCGLIKEIKNFK